MPNWAESMQQTYEYYIVDPVSWRNQKQITNVISSTINRDLNSETLGSASFKVTDSVGECYIRTYLVTIQNGVTEKHCLGTHLIQTPSSSFDGKIRTVTMDGYTPLLELKENKPPIGYSILRGENGMGKAYAICSDNMRAPVISNGGGSNAKYNLNYNFVAQTDDTWLSFTKDLLDTIEFHFDLDETSRLIFSPNQKIETLQPVWTYTDDNSSIMYPDIDLDHDLYGIPNVVELVYSMPDPPKDSSGNTLYVKVVNDDPDSPTSTIARGREIIYRSTDISLVGNPTKSRLFEYAKNLLKELSTINYTVSYTHGYCPVRVGDCVRINSKRASLDGVKAKVISQSIKCESGCPVSEKALFTVNLWG